MTDMHYNVDCSRKTLAQLLEVVAMVQELGPANFTLYAEPSVYKSSRFPRFLTNVKDAKLLPKLHLKIADLKAMKTSIEVAKKFIDSDLLSDASVVVQGVKRNELKVLVRPQEPLEVITAVAIVSPPVEVKEEVPEAPVEAPAKEKPQWKNNRNWKRSSKSGSATSIDTEVASESASLPDQDQPT